MYKKINNIVLSGLLKSYEEIHNQLNKETRYIYKGNNTWSPYAPPNKGGIYIMFEKGEKIGDLDRIVRVGKAEESLLTRLTQHFINENKDHSILRKHIGRAWLHKGELENNVTYINDTNNWNTKSVKCPDIEEVVTQHLIDNFSFCCYTNFSTHEEISKLEQTLIETLSMYNRLYKEQTGKEIFSKNWLGKYCTNEKVKTSGLWNDEHVRNWKK